METEPGEASCLKCLKLSEGSPCSSESGNEDSTRQPTCTAFPTLRYLRWPQTPENCFPPTSHPTPPSTFSGLSSQLFNLNIFLLEIALKAGSFVPGRGKGMTFPGPLKAAVVVVAVVAVVAEVLGALLCSAVPWLAQRWGQVWKALAF